MAPYSGKSIENPDSPLLKKERARHEQLKADLAELELRNHRASNPPFHLSRLLVFINLSRSLLEVDHHTPLLT